MPFLASYIEKEGFHSQVLGAIVVRLGTQLKVQRPFDLTSAITDTANSQVSTPKACTVLSWLGSTFNGSILCSDEEQE